MKRSKKEVIYAWETGQDTDLPEDYGKLFKSQPRQNQLVD
jgi:hypothetical protein